MNETNGLPGDKIGISYPGDNKSRNVALQFSRASKLRF
jgi:hypothetical protein